MDNPGNVANSTKEFGGIAVALARNPLTIIALFIVLVYGVAGLVTAFSGSFSASERVPLIYFLVIFPVLVLSIFTWLVIQHSTKLFGPSDYKDESNYVKMQLYAVARLAVAGSKGQSGLGDEDLDQAVRVVQQMTPPKAIEAGRSNRILWVDDRPDNNIYERQAFQAIGLSFTLSLNTRDALEKLAQDQFAAVISDMGRMEGPREGYVLLDEMRRNGDQTPLFFYAASNSPEHQKETREHGGQGCTNNANDLYAMVVKSVIRR